MKNILKKLGVLGLIIAVLSPFIELPKVNAAETCTDHTIQQYMFLDVKYPKYFDDYTGSGYATYTSFAYLFPELGTNQYIKILGINTISDITSDENSTITLGKYFGGVTTLYDKDNRSSDEVELLGTYTTYDKSSYKLVSLLHGFWSKESDIETQEPAGWDMGKENDFINHSIQEVLRKNDKEYTSDDFATSVSGAIYTSKYSQASEFDTLVEYFEKIANNNNSDYTNYVYTSDSTEYMSLRINRKADEDIFNQLVFGYECVDETTCGKDNKGKYAIYTENATTATIETISNSYNALLDSQSDGAAGHVIYADNDSKIHIMTNEKYYWPTVVTVEYEVCTTSNDVTPAVNWTLDYDDNVDDTSVTNMPKDQTETIGTNIAVSSDKPSRTGYAFDGWCKGEKTCTTPLNSGDIVESPTATETITLYAQWKKTGTEENKKTGVMSYVLGFAAVGVVAGGIYLISKKKNLFQQI